MTYRKTNLGALCMQEVNNKANAPLKHIWARYDDSPSPPPPPHCLQMLHSSLRIDQMLCISFWQTET